MGVKADSITAHLQNRLPGILSSPCAVGCILTQARHEPWQAAVAIMGSRSGVKVRSSGCCSTMAVRKCLTGGNCAAAFCWMTAKPACDQENAGDLLVPPQCL